MSLVRSHATRALHLTVLLVVLHQLGSSLFAERPLPGEAPEWPLFLHEWIGVVGVGALTLFWLWVLVRNRAETPLVRLVPWFSREGRAAVIADVVGPVRQILAGRTPSLRLDALASAVHGLGLSLASFLALSGAAWYFVFNGTSYGRTVMGLHSLAGNLMWAYVIGHALMALAHQLWGDPVFARMFWRRPARRRVSIAPAE